MSKSRRWEVIGQENIYSKTTIRQNSPDYFHENKRGKRPIFWLSHSLTFFGHHILWWSESGWLVCWCAFQTCSQSSKPTMSTCFPFLAGKYVLFLIFWTFVLLWHRAKTQAHHFILCVSLWYSNNKKHILAVVVRKVSFFHRDRQDLEDNLLSQAQLRFRQKVNCLKSRHALFKPGTAVT